MFLDKIDYCSNNRQKEKMKYTTQTVQVIPDKQIIEELLKAQRGDITVRNPDVLLIGNEIKFRMSFFTDKNKSLRKISTKNDPVNKFQDVSNEQIIEKLLKAQQDNIAVGNPDVLLISNEIKFRMSFFTDKKRFERDIKKKTVQKT